MKTEETISALKALKGIIEWEYSLDFQVALSKAIRCLNKELPKEPEEIEKPDKLGRIFYVYICPNCGENVIEGTRCKRCGQVLDWSGAIKNQEKGGFE